MHKLSNGCPKEIGYGGRASTLNGSEPAVTLKPFMVNEGSANSKLRSALKKSVIDAAPCPLYSWPSLRRRYVTVKGIPCINGVSEYSLLTRSRVAASERSPPMITIRSIPQSDSRRSPVLHKNDSIPASDDKRNYL